jgi:hypothetical protein
MSRNLALDAAERADFKGQTIVPPIDVHAQLEGI